jgi:hypothetical protein
MKKLVIAVAAVAFLASCKKDYVCECTTIIGGVSTITASVDLGKQSKSDAEDACSAQVGTPVVGSTKTCTAKEK